jgi:hypothetical protein
MGFEWLRERGAIKAGKIISRGMLDWLNANSQLRSAQRVASILTTVQQIAKLERGRTFDLDAYARTIILLNEQLARYQLIPSIRMFPQQGYWDVIWQKAGTHDSTEQQPNRKNEGDSITRLIRLGALGLVGRLRVCKCPCGRWFYAAKDGQAFYSGACNQKYHSTLPSFKAKRRKYMKKYRRDWLSNAKYKQSRRYSRKSA